MSIGYIFEGPPTIPVPYSPTTGLDSSNNVFYVTSRTLGWVPIGGGLLGGPVIQSSMQFVNTNEPHSISQTAAETTMYAVSIYMDALGDGGPSDTVVVSLTWTQPSTNVVHTVDLVLPGDVDNVQMETYPILAKAGTPITLSSSFTGAPFHYDISARLVQMPGN